MSLDLFNYSANSGSHGELKSELKVPRDEEEEEEEVIPGPGAGRCLTFSIKLKNGKVSSTMFGNFDS